MTKTKFPSATVLLLCWLLCGTSNGQTVCQPDSVRMYYDRNEINELEWTDNYTDVCDVTFSYNPEGLLTQFYKATTHINPLINPYAYDEFVSWECSYTYDIRHRCVNQKKAQLGCGTDICVYYSFRDFFYEDESATPLSALNLMIRGCDAHTPVDSLWTEYEFDYDSLGRIVRENLQRGGKGFKEVRYEYGFNTMTETLDAYSGTDNNTWKTLTRVTRTYDDNGTLLSSLRTLHNDSTRLTLYNYDENGHLTEALIRKRINGEFFDEKRVVYELNSEGLPVTVRFEKKADSEWVEGTSPVYWLNQKYLYDKLECWDFFFFTDNYLKIQNDLLSDGGVKRMELFYTKTSAPGYELEDQDQLHNNVNIFPNPTSNFVTVSDKGIQRVEIHNLLGQRTACFFGYGEDNVTIDLSGLTKGIYLVSSQDKEGRVSTKKLIVQ